MIGINRSMSRTGTRPERWKVQGEIPHAQYCAWLQMKAQASYRKEIFTLSFEDYQSVWGNNWHLKGRGVNSYCLTRNDLDGAWTVDNILCIPRTEYLKRKKRWKTKTRTA
jgi:hypothetical protein